ncbi:DoxX family protein [Polyangium jinanense]|uniref:DoxX family protein n=1 Tax=Polyangium jinanense TaxID=2829994 RepID=A0A9X4ASV9_9BACT|nr:DoxX family protein [Polyangium jinanense]MDC3955244.1 DoxX family protein [Polyangium jinanense]MDC3981545.1 DoxX family protein [Polyangium jinanense]
MNDKARTIGYWAATGLLAFAFAAGGVGDLSGAPQVLEGMTHLGYPAYFATILGVWKVLGAVALLAPRFPRLKEWAYAGIFFDLTGAAASHAASGDPAGKVITPLVLVAIAAASWALRPESRKLASETKREADARIGKPALAT